MTESFLFKVYPSAWRANDLDTPPAGEEFIAMVTPVYSAGRVFKTGVYTIEMSLVDAAFDDWTRAGFTAQTQQQELYRDIHYLSVPHGGTGTATSNGVSSDTFFIYASDLQYDVITVTVSTNTQRPAAPPTSAGGTVTTIVRDDSAVVMDTPTLTPIPGVTSGAATPESSTHPAQSGWQITPPKDIRGMTFTTEDRSTRPLDGRYTPTVTVAFPPGIRALHSNKGAFQAQIVWYDKNGNAISTENGPSVPFNNLSWQSHPSFDLLGVTIPGRETHTSVAALRPGTLNSLIGMQSALFGKADLFSPTVTIPAGSSFSVMGAVNASTVPAGSSARVNLPTIAHAGLKPATALGVPALTPALSGTQWRYVVHVSSGKPWEPGTTEDVVVLRQAWQNNHPVAYLTPDFTLPANAWLKVELEVQTGSAVSLTGVIMDFSAGLGSFSTWESLPVVGGGTTSMPPGASKGTLTGGNMSFPIGRTTGDWYLVLAPLPTAVTALFPTAKSGDAVQWDGAKWVLWPSGPAAGGGGGPTATTTQTGVTGVAPKAADTYGVRITYTPDAADQYTTYDQLTVLFTNPTVTVTWDAPDPHFWAEPNKSYIGVMSLLGSHFTDGDVVVAIDRLSDVASNKETPVFRGEYVIRGERFYFFDTTVPFNDSFVYRLTIRSADGTHKTTYLTEKSTYPAELSNPHGSECVPVFLSDPLVPSLSLWTGLLLIDPLSHPGRRELSDVINRHTPVSLSDVRGTPRTVFHIMTRTLAEREHLLKTVATGRILFYRNPNPKYPENNWFISVGEVTENRIFPDHARPERKFDLEIALVSRPAGLLSMSGGRTYRMLRDYEKNGVDALDPQTYQHIRDTYTDYVDVLLGEPSGFININTRPEYVYGAGLYPTRIAAETSWSLV